MVRSSVLYTGIARDLIHLFKFGGYWGLASLISDVMIEDGRSMVKEERDIVVVGVPLHRVRLRERGYDQAGMLSRVLSGRLGLDCFDGALKRKKNTRPQAQLPLDERAGNLSNAFSVTEPSKFRDKSVLLIDDVTTSGITLGSCSTALTMAGARRVLALTFARRTLIESVEGG
jgi:ComF family protein